MGMVRKVLRGPRLIDRRVPIEGVMQHENRETHFGWSERHFSCRGRFETRELRQPGVVCFLFFVCFFVFLFFFMFFGIVKIDDEDEGSKKTKLLINT